MKTQIFKVWEDNSKKYALIEAKNASIALDLAAQKWGFIDYPDMAQSKKWDTNKNQGLNILSVGD